MFIEKYYTKIDHGKNLKTLYLYIWNVIIACDFYRYKVNVKYQELEKAKQRQSQLQSNYQALKSEKKTWKANEDAYQKELKKCTVKKVKS